MKADAQKLDEWRAQTNGRPKVSVVLSVFGDCGDLSATISSVLRQTLDSFEIILVDDGNSPKARTLINQVAQHDTRIRVLTNELNMGLTKSLVRGCNAAEAPYIARIDCGDLMVPEDRLTKQFDLLESDPELALVCGGVEMWDFLNRKRWRSRLKEKHHEEIINQPRYIAWADHPTVMFRKSTYVKAGGYDERMVVGQDMELWPRMAKHGRLFRMAEVLAIRALNPDSISVARNAHQIRRKIQAINEVTSLGLATRLKLVGKEYLKIVVPIRQRLNIRHRTAMDYLGPIPGNVGGSLPEVINLPLSPKSKTGRRL